MEAVAWEGSGVSLGGMSGGHPAEIWEASWKDLEGLGDLGGLLEVSGRGIWEASWRHLGGTWEAAGRHLGPEGDMGGQKGFGREKVPKFI